MSNLSGRLKFAGVESARKHLFFCIGPDCCQAEEGKELWANAKKETKNLKNPVMRTKTGCFRICCEGPWLVVYPDGIWYPRMTPERLDRVLQEHVEGGQPVEEWVAARSLQGDENEAMSE